MEKERNLRDDELEKVNGGENEIRKDFYENVLSSVPREHNVMLSSTNKNEDEELLKGGVGPMGYDCSGLIV